MADFEIPDMPTPPQLTPHMLVGAASPLWTYFGAAAAGGVAYWWMTRWTDRANLEAMFGRAAAVPATLPMVVETASQAVAETAEDLTQVVTEAVAETADQIAAAVETIAEADPLPEAPVGGEAAPISPAVLTLTPEPAAVETPEPVVETPPAVEATADPLPEPTAKPRVRKGPAPNGLEA